MSTMGASVFLETVWQDLRFGGRTLRRNPGFAVIAVVTLALGIGANAAIFSVVNAVLLRPLPWHEPDRAVMIWSRWTAFDKTWVASGEVVDYRRRTRTLDSVATWNDGQANLTGEGDPERVAVGAVSANTFSTLGASPFLGRTFTEQEDLPKGPNLAVLGHSLWNRRFAAEPAVIGSRAPRGTVSRRPLDRSAEAMHTRTSASRWKSWALSPVSSHNWSRIGPARLASLPAPPLVSSSNSGPGDQAPTLLRRSSP